jgi:arylsulfatase A-like enzyme
MSLLKGALIRGIAFGFAAGTVEIWLSLVPFMERRMGPGPGFLLQVALLQTALGAVLGLAAAPLLRLRGGNFIHLLALAFAWFGLERWVALDSPAFAALEWVAPTGAALLVLLGAWIARRRALVAWATGALLLAAGATAPQVYLAATTPAPPPAPARAAAPPGAPDVVLMVLDTVRARNVSTYGYARPTAPEFDALAREGALFLDATSPSTWSLPSHASLFTGRYPSSHGAHGEHQYLDARFPTLAQELARNGYETFCFTSNAWISDGLGLTRGFDFQDASWKSGGGPGLGFSFIHRLLDRLGLQARDKGGAVVADHFEAWARARPAEGVRPAFVFLNFIEAHFPYHQLPHDYLWRFTERGYGDLRSISVDLVAQQFGGEGRPVEAVGEPARAMYDGGVAYTSRLLDRVVSALRARGTLDRTVLVVLADHGEILGERAGFFGHGPSLYQESVGVPLFVRYPPRIPAGARVEAPVSTLGVFATILDLAGLAQLPTLQVGSLAPLATGTAGASGGPILSELQRTREITAERPDVQMSGAQRYRLFREGSLKLVERTGGPPLLYDLAADPGETRDLAAERPADAARMLARLGEVRASLDLPAIDGAMDGEGERPELDEATREQLRALGYSE